MGGRKTEIAAQQPKLWNSNYIKVWLVNFMLHFAFTLIVPLLPLYLSENFGADKHMIGLCLAGYTIMAIVIRPFSGYIVDNFPRKTVLMIFSFLFALVFGGYVIAGSLLVFTIFRTLHGLPFGALTVSANTVAIDVLPAERRVEGIGYYGLSNNIATVIGPAAAIFVLEASGHNFQVLFWLSLVMAVGCLFIASSVKLKKKEIKAPTKTVLSLDRFFLTNCWREAFSLVFLAVAHGIMQTYVAIYGKEELGIMQGTGLFFSLFAIGLIVSRLTGAHALRKNKVSRNASMGVLISLCGYLLFASVHTLPAYYITAFIVGMGNGHMWPAYQTMFVNLAENNKRGTAISSILTSWDFGGGMGILLGGVLADASLSTFCNYHTAFWAAFIFEAIGVSCYFSFVRAHFEKNKLR